MNNLIRMISEDGGVSVVALDSTNIVTTMEELHQTSAVVSAALGRLLTAGAIMGSGLKHPDDSLTLRIDGNGPIGPMVVVSDGEGNVRGYASTPVVELPLRADGKLDVGSAVGNDGTLAVIRDLGLKEPYVGKTPLASGEIAEDITAYYAASEQTPSVCALGVLVNKDLSIQRAGGFLLQLLPGATEAEITHLEENIQALPPVTNMLEDGMTPRQIAELALAGFSPQLLDESRVEYRCYCSQEKTRDILASLGSEELHQMMEEDPVAQAECHFCGKSYRFPIEDLLEEKSKNARA